MRAEPVRLIDGLPRFLVAALGFAATLLPFGIQRVLDRLCHHFLYCIPDGIVVGEGGRRMMAAAAAESSAKTTTETTKRAAAHQHVKNTHIYARPFVSTDDLDVSNVSRRICETCKNSCKQRNFLPQSQGNAILEAENDFFRFYPEKQGRLQQKVVDTMSLCKSRDEPMFLVISKTRCPRKMLCFRGENERVAALKLPHGRYILPLF